ncbi:hypothetical protein BHE97_09445 [Aeromicrobium sp. PE09-221]|uniref:hypothetical protein n=1 Tax=Aeromicrobium sp. PE09-221 TaxID=1898043 RepID=UPI000B3E6339|nr:hypothetical protein [Aeromicrobium sp. PE09-221]OUZ09685.1 hypothetical protein BHE97_09445 [Aeromicrobium sp. PE09-221]
MIAPLGRRLLMAGTTSFVLTIAAILALHAASSVLTVAAVAATTVLLAWFGHSASSAEHSGLAEVNAAWALPLALVGRARFGEFLPTLVVQLGAALVAGFGASALGPRIGEPLLFADPTFWHVGLITLLTGVLTAWVVLAVDGAASEALIAVPAIAAGSGPSIVLVIAANPAVTLGAAAGGLLPWTIAAITAVGLLAVTAAAAFAISLVAPETSS